MVNSPLIRPHFLGVPLDSHDRKHPFTNHRIHWDLPFRLGTGATHTHPWSHLSLKAWEGFLIRSALEWFEWICGCFSFGGGVVSWQKWGTKIPSQFVGKEGPDDYPKAGKFVNLHFPWIYIFARIYIPNLRKLKGKCKFYIFPKNVVFRWKIQDFCKDKNFPIFLKTKNYYFFPYPCSAPWTFQVWWQSCYPGPFSLLWNIKYTSLSSYKHTGTNQSSWVTLTTHRYMQKSQVHACQITSAQVQIKFQEHFKHCDNSQVHAKVSSIHACQIRSTPVQIKLHEKHLHLTGIHPWSISQVQIDCQWFSGSLICNWFLDCTYGATVPVSLYPFWTCTWDLYLRACCTCALEDCKIVLMELMVLDFVRQDLYLWSL